MKITQRKKHIQSQNLKAKDSFFKPRLAHMAPKMGIDEVKDEKNVGYANQIK